MKYAAVALLCLALSGCSSLNDVRNSDNQYTFDVNDNYQKVYRNIQEISKQCWEGTAITADYVVDTQLYSELGTAEVAWKLVGIAMPVYYLDIEIKRVSSNKSHVVVHRASYVHAYSEQVVKQWAKGEMNTCD